MLSVFQDAMVLFCFSACLKDFLVLGLLPCHKMEMYILTAKTLTSVLTSMVFEGLNIGVSRSPSVLACTGVCYESSCTFKVF